MRKNLIAIMSGLAFLPAVGHAAAPTLGEVLDASGITATGHASASYAYSNNTVAPFVPGANGMSPGAYTGESNSFTFNQAELAVSKLPTEGFGALVDVIAGQDASKLNNFAGGSDFNLHQAYVQYATGGLTVIGGKFATLAGAEVVSDNMNSNVTRSLLFSIQPVTLTGLRAGYKFNDIITAYAGVNNSVSGATQDNNKQKTTEAGVAVTPIKDLAINVTNYYGKETAGSGDKYELVDLNVTYTIGPVALGLNADHSKADVGATTTKIDGVALYANYQITAAFRAGLRGEYLKAKTDAGGVSTDAKAKEITLTGDYSVNKNVDLLAEVRYDKADAGFVDGAGVAKDNATTLVAKAIYKF